MQKNTEKYRKNTENAEKYRKNEKNRKYSKILKNAEQNI